MEHAVEKPKQVEGKAAALSRRGAEPSHAQAPLHPALQLQQQAGNQAVQELLRADAKLAVNQPESTPHPAALTADAPVWPYPAIAAALPRDVVALRVSASVRVPLHLLLRPDVNFVDQDIWDAFLANRRTHGSDTEAVELLRNEMMRQYFAGKLSLHDPVEIDVTPPLGPGEPASVVFRLHGQEVFTPDGMIGVGELFMLGPIGPVVKRVQQEASHVELAGKLLDELDDLEPMVKELEGVHAEPEAFALNTVFSIRGRVLVAKEALDYWECRTGPVPTAASKLISRYSNILSVAKDAAFFMTRWHEAHPIESAGEANVRRGRGSGWLGRVFWGLVDAGEETLSLGYHNTRTKLSEAYDAGDLSWNEVKGLSNKAARRVILTAAVMGQLGRFTSRFSASFASGLGPGYTAVKVGAGTVLGGLSSATTLASQTVLTRFGGDNFSPVGQDIWNAGAPDARDWAIGVPFGMLLGGLYGARPVAPSTAGRRMSGPSGLIRKFPVWSRLNFGEPIMMGASEANIELLGDAPGIPGGSTIGPSTPALQTPAPGAAFEQPTTPAPRSTVAPTPSLVTGQPTAAPNISLGYRPIIVYPPGQSQPAPAPISAQQLASIPNISAAEVQALQRMSPAAWSRLVQYATSNRNVFSVKGKAAEEVYFSGAGAAARRQQAIQVAAGLGIPSDAVQFTSDVRGQTPTRTSAGGTGELGDGIFYAIRGRRVYILAIVESKSPSNKAELAHKVSDDEREYLGQLAWDFERLRELPITINGRTFSPEDVVVSRTFTRFIGVLPKGSSLSQASLTAIRNQLTNIDTDSIDVSDGVLNELARLITSTVGGS